MKRFPVSRRQVLLGLLVVPALLLLNIDRWLGQLARPVIEAEAGKAGITLGIEHIRTAFWDGRLSVQGLSVAGSGGQAPLANLRRLDLAWSWPELLKGRLRIQSAEIESLVIRPALLQSKDTAAETDVQSLKARLGHPPLMLDLLEIRRSQFEDGHGGRIRLHWLRLERKRDQGAWSFAARSKADVDMKRDGAALSLIAEARGSASLNAEKLRLLFDGEWRMHDLQMQHAGTRFKAGEIKLQGQAGVLLSGSGFDFSGLLGAASVDVEQDDARLRIAKLELNGRSGFSHDRFEFDGSTRLAGLNVAQQQAEASVAQVLLQGRQRFISGDKGGMDVKGSLSAHGVRVKAGFGEALIDAVSVPLDALLRLQPDATPLWRLAAGEIAKPLRLQLGRADAPPLPVMLVEKFAWPQLDASRPEQAGEYRAEMRVGEAPEIGRVRFTGNLAVLAQPISGRGTMALQMEAAPFSRFAEQEFGLRLDSGRVLMDAEAEMKGATLTAATKLTMIHLRVSRASSETMRNLEAAIGLSPDAALDLLRDANDTISLDVPLQLEAGAAREGLQLGLKHVYAKAMMGALKKAALGYVKNLFQPYGMAIDAVQWLGQKSLKMRLSPVFFRQGLAAIDPGAEEALAKMARFLAEHPKLSVAVCGVVTEAEARLVDGGPDAWEKLARARSERTIERLLERGVSRDQMTLCHVQKDGGKDARPRAEVLL